MRSLATTECDGVLERGLLPISGSYRERATENPLILNPKIVYTSLTKSESLATSCTDCRRPRLSENSVGRAARLVTSMAEQDLGSVISNFSGKGQK